MAVQTYPRMLFHPTLGHRVVADLPAETALTAAGWSLVPVPAPDTATELNVQALGALGSGVGDDTPVIALAFSTVTAGHAVRFPSGRYPISSTLLPPSNIRILGPGTLVATASLGTFAPVIDLDTKTDVTIDGLEIDGAKSAFAGVTEYRHGIRIIGASKRITLRDCYLHDCKGDGLYIGSGDGSTYVEHVQAERLRCDANHRQGLSITSLRSAVFRDCWFTNTSGTAPECGVDLEPNAAGGYCQDILFEGGGSYGNAQHGALFQWPTTSSVQRNVTFRGFVSRNNILSGVAINQGKGVTIDGCWIYENGERGIVATDNCRGLALLNSRVYLNGLQGIYVLGQFNTKFMTGLRIIGNRLFDNSVAVANAVDAIRIDWAAGAVSGCVGTIVAHNNCGNQDTANQRFALTTDGAGNMIDTVLDGNYFKGCATGFVNLNDDGATRRARGNVGLADTA